MAEGIGERNVQKHGAKETLKVDMWSQAGFFVQYYQGNETESENVGG